MNADASRNPCIQAEVAAQARPRLDGLDLARFLAFVGMVFVNFRVAIAPPDSGFSWLGSLIEWASQKPDPDWLVQMLGLLEGRAAATFVVLAGVGLGLAARRSSNPIIKVMLKRSAFLLVAGLLNSLIFQADILHYYAIYFAIGVFCLGFGSIVLSLLTVGIVLLFPILLMFFNYDIGWDWTTYGYVDFWTPTGFFRNLFYNGWHPVIPWIAFLLFGILISRLDLHRRSVQVVLVILGTTAMFVIEGFSSFLIYLSEGSDIHELVFYCFGTEPIPPMPFYMIVGSGAACTVIGLSLLCASWWGNTRPVKALCATGRQTLTLYVAHIVIGMGILEWLGMIESSTVTESVYASLIFCGASVLYCSLWSLKFKRGPLEWLMRRLAG